MVTYGRALEQSDRRRSCAMRMLRWIATLYGLRGLCVQRIPGLCAKVAELADAPDLGSGSRKALGVRLPPFAPEERGSLMKTEFVDVNETRKNVRVEIPSDVVNAEIDRIARGYSKKARVPGFRPGKAQPMSSSSDTRIRSCMTSRT